MSNSSAAPGPPMPDEPADHADTLGWIPPTALAPADGANAPTQPRPAASTPGPQAPERGTHPNSTADPPANRPADPLDPQGALPRLPPVPGYDVQRFVGRGGMGLVYQAVHRATGRTVALKLVIPGGSHDRVTRERFAREVHTLAALKHANIVPVYDAGDWHGFPYCAMEFVPGGTLGQHLERIRTDLRSSVQLMVKVARAVAAMHAAGVLHRDLKPLNILLGENDEPMVADFGLARWAGDDSDLTHTGLPIGTRHYMSPEQTLGQREDYSTACDVWALGVTLFEVLTGARPFTDEGGDLYTRIRCDDPPPVGALAPHVPADLEAIALRCLAKRPNERYATAAGVADDLERWLQGEPVVAAVSTALTVPEPPPPKKLSRRTRVLLIGAGVLLAAALVAIFVFRPSPPPDPVKKTLAERVASGEKVKLTDEKGRSTVSWTQTPGHQVGEKEAHGYHWFTTTETGIVALADDKWELPIRVEADVAVPYESVHGKLGGVFVGRQAWQAADRKHEALVWCGVSPRDKFKEPIRRVMGCTTGLYWWEQGQPNQPPPFHEEPKPWDRDGKREDVRFAQVVIEVHATHVSGTVDGVSLKSVTEDWALRELDLKVIDRKQFAPFTFTPPAFGNGIGIFCQKAHCAVLNLSVSKLTP